MAETCVSQTAEYKAAQLGPKKTGTERSVISSLWSCGPLPEERRLKKYILVSEKR